jgi:hypothetical protein
MKWSPTLPPPLIQSLFLSLFTHTYSKIFGEFKLEYWKNMGCATEREYRDGGIPFHPFSFLNLWQKSLGRVAGEDEF